MTNTYSIVFHTRLGDRFETWDTALDIKEFKKRLDRIDWLRVLTEGYEEGEGYSICQKALRAFNKHDGFTGIIRLTSTEKDFLGYIYFEDEHLDQLDKETLEYYIYR